eukprot:scaffold224318_cov19-Prasinocladus_malaysianus.AAC.1
MHRQHRRPIDIVLNSARRAPGTTIESDMASHRENCGQALRLRNHSNLLAASYYCQNSRLAHQTLSGAPIRQRH